jgi:hypothetical protein
LWEKQGLLELLQRLVQDRNFAFSIDRAAFAMDLQRLGVPGSDLAGSEWIKTVESPGFEGSGPAAFLPDDGLSGRNTGGIGE